MDGITFSYRESNFRFQPVLQDQGIPFSEIFYVERGDIESVKKELKSRVRKATISLSAVKSKKWD